MRGSCVPGRIVWGTSTFPAERGALTRTHVHIVALRRDGDKGHRRPARDERIVAPGRPRISGFDNPRSSGEDSFTRHGRPLRDSTSREFRGRGLGLGRCRGRRRCGWRPAIVPLMFGSGQLVGGTRAGPVPAPQCRLGNQARSHKNKERPAPRLLALRAGPAIAGCQPLRRLQDRWTAWRLSMALVPPSRTRTM